MLHSVRGHAAAVVRDCYLHTGFFCPLRQCDCTTLRGEFECIGKQIRPDDLRKPRICIDCCTVLKVCFKLNIFPFPYILKLHGTIAKLSAYIKNFRHWPNRLLFQLVQFEHILDKVCQPLGGITDILHLFRLLVRKPTTLLQHFRIAGNDGQRRFELVGNI